MSYFVVLVYFLCRVCFFFTPVLVGCLEPLHLAFNTTVAAAAQQFDLLADGSLRSRLPNLGPHQGALL